MMIKPQGFLNGPCGYSRRLERAALAANCTPAVSPLHRAGFLSRVGRFKGHGEPEIIPSLCLGCSMAAQRAWGKFFPIAPMLLQQYPGLGCERRSRPMENQGPWRRKPN